MNETGNGVGPQIVSSTNEETQAVNAPSIPLRYKVGIFLVTAMIGTAIFLLLHAPIPFEVAALVSSLFLAIRSPEIMAELRNAH